MPSLDGFENLLVGHATSDDAAVIRIDGDRLLVQTVDFFTPIVDDPELFGEIAAANAISDVYAMGAEPILGLALAMFPTDKLPLSVLEGILRGGARKAAEAGFPVAGGHTIIDDIPKYGLAVTGIVEKARLVRNSTARAGNILYLTKPIGSGILVCAWRALSGSALRRAIGPPAPVMDEAIEWMVTLNRDAARIMTDVGVCAATDVTGYGLLGHLFEMCEASHVGARLIVSEVPVFEGTRDYLSRGYAPEGTLRNENALREKTRVGVDELSYRLVCDAQTSGGLLIAIDPDRAAELERRFAEAGLRLWRIGEITDETGTIELN